METCYAPNNGTDIAPTVPQNLTPVILALLSGEEDKINTPILAITDICTVQTLGSSVTRLVLDDAERCIQALLHPQLESKLALGNDEGDDDVMGKLVELKDFTVEVKGEETAQKEVVFLLIRDMDILPQPGLELPWIRPRAVPIPTPQQETMSSLGSMENVQQEETGSVSYQFLPPPQKKPPTVVNTTTRPRPVVPTIRKPGIALLKAREVQKTEDEEDNFETMKINPSRLTQQRQELQQPIPPPRAPFRSTKPSLFPLSSSTPLHLTLLHKIPFLPYKQNWSLSTLCVISSISSIEPSHLPPYTQRTARLAHPSTNKRVHLTVFLQPEEFSPGEGSVVLLVGVKNHRFDGGCLKKYASDKPPDGHRWWVESPRFSWCEKEMEELRIWWDGEEKKVQATSK